MIDSLFFVFIVEEITEQTVSMTVQVWWIFCLVKMPNCKVLTASLNLITVGSYRQLNNFELMPLFVAFDDVTGT